MNWFTVVFDVLSFLGSAQGAALVKKLEAAGADAADVLQAFTNHAGLPAIEAALAKLLADVTASNAAA